MTPADGCGEMELLMQADLDGELSPAEAARIGAHVPGCAHCTAMQAEFLAASANMRAASLSYPLPPGLEGKIRARLGGVKAGPAQRGRLRAQARRAAPFGAGFALAACLALAFVLSRGDGMAGTVVASHVRALQPGHLMDVVSTDQHTVKPWFDGRIDFAPPVKNLAPAGFPLTGGRLDYLAGRPVAALVYGRDRHLIDLFVWPAGRGELTQTGSRNGYNFVHWTEGGMVFWAVSDLNAVELADFARLWRAG